MTTRVVEPTAGDLLRHAASLIEEWGWTKGKFVNAQGAMCEVGALAAAGGRHKHVFLGGRWYRETSYDRWRSFDAALSALQWVGGGTSHNDSHDTTKERVIAKLLEAADYADAHAVG